MSLSCLSEPINGDCFAFASFLAGDRRGKALRFNFIVYERFRFDCCVAISGRGDVVRRKLILRFDRSRPRALHTEGQLPRYRVQPPQPDSCFAYEGQTINVGQRSHKNRKSSFFHGTSNHDRLFILRQFYSSRQPDRSRFVASPRAYNQDRPQRPKHRSTATKITIEAWTGFLIMLYLFLSRLLNFWKTLLSSVDNVTSPGHWNYFFWKGPQQGCVIKCMEIQSFFDYIESIVT